MSCVVVGVNDIDTNSYLATQNTSRDDSDNTVLKKLWTDRCIKRWCPFVFGNHLQIIVDRSLNIQTLRYSDLPRR